MIGELLSIPGAMATFLVSLIVFGVAPGPVLAMIVRLIPDMDRRRELQAELYEVPPWERPYWVAQQMEVAIRIGLCPRMSWYWGRYVWHRCRIESGLGLHIQHPETFWVPDRQVKEHLRPGDTVKLMWAVKRSHGERMWVTITERKGDRFVGTLDNYAISAYLEPGESVQFHVDDIIDYVLDEEMDDEVA